MAQLKRRVRMTTTNNTGTDAAFAVSVFVLGVVTVVIALLVFLEFLSSASPLLAVTAVLCLAAFSFSLGRALRSRARALPKNLGLAGPPQLTMKSRRLRRSA